MFFFSFFRISFGSPAQVFRTFVRKLPAQQLPQLVVEPGLGGQIGRHSPSQCQRNALAGSSRKCPAVAASECRVNPPYLWLSGTRDIERLADRLGLWRILWSLCAVGVRHAHHHQNDSRGNLVAALQHDRTRVWLSFALSTGFDGHRHPETQSSQEDEGRNRTPSAAWRTTWFHTG